MLKKLLLIIEFPFAMVFICTIGVLAGANPVEEIHDYSYLWIQRWEHPESSHRKER